MPPVPRPRALRGLAAALLLVPPLLAACGDDDDPVGPTPPEPTGQLTVAQYVDSALALMEGYSVNERIQWPAFRQRWRARAANATTYRATYPIIDSALAELDPHSSIYPPDRLPGSTDAPPENVGARVAGRTVAPRIAYVWVPGFTGRTPQGRVDSTHQILRQLDAESPCGWVVDLRGNPGGFFFYLMASVGPLYASGSGVTLVGGQRFADGYRYLWHYRQRADGRDAFGLRDARDSVDVVTVANAWRPRRPGLPVAVLHGFERNARGQLVTVTASAGESITLAFRGGPPTRSFGSPTYGVASGRNFFFMPDSARIDITDSYMFDRLGYAPEDGPIPVDEAIASPSPLRIGDPADPVIAAATRWLQARPECTNPTARQNRRSDGRATVVPSMPTDGRRLRAEPRAIYRPSATPERRER